MTHIGVPAENTMTTKAHRAVGATAQLVAFHAIDRASKMITAHGARTSAMIWISLADFVAYQLANWRNIYGLCQVGP